MCSLPGIWRRRLHSEILLDHDVPDDLSYLLEELEHEVTLLRKALPGGSSDEVVLQSEAIPDMPGRFVVRVSRAR